MSLSPAIKLTGANDEHGWVHVYEYAPPTDSLHSSRGDLYVLVSLKLDTSIELGVHSRNTSLSVVSEIGSAIRDYYYESTEESLYSAQRKALERVFESNMFGESLEVCVLVLMGENVYLSAFGGGIFGIVRDGRFMKVLEGMPLQVTSASGVLQAQDTCVFGTMQFMGRISKKIDTLFENGKIDHDALLALCGEENASRTGVLIKKYGGQASLLPVRLSAPTFVWRDKIVARLDGMIGRLSKRRLRVSPELMEKGRSRRVLYAPIVGLALLLMLSVSVWFGVRRSAKLRRAAEYAQVLEVARHNLDEARNLSALNPGRSKELVLGAKKSVDELTSSGRMEPPVLELKSEIEKGLSEIAGVYKSSPQVYLNLSLIREGFVGSKIDISNGVVQVLDMEHNRLAALEVSTKKTELLAGKDDLFNAFSVSAYSNRSFVMSIDGVREVGDEVVLQVKSDEWDANRSLFSVFAGNIYVLDKQNNMIYRYPGNRRSFLPAQDWFAPGIEPILADIVSLAIDGKVWLQDVSGRIRVFERGVPQSFNVTGVDPEISTGGDIFTDEESMYLYILDKTNNRVIVLNKSGEYVAQYEDSDFSGISEIVVSEVNRALLYLKGSNLMHVPLKHI